MALRLSGRFLASALRSSSAASQAQGTTTTAASAVSKAGRRAFSSIEGTFGDKERAEERIHFRKEDERLLRKLLAKVKAQADTTDVHEAAGAQASEISAVKAILGKYSVSDADIQKLVDWKHAH